MWIRKSLHEAILAKQDWEHQFKISDIKMAALEKEIQLQEELARLKMQLIGSDNLNAVLRGRLVAFAHEHGLPAPSEKP